MGLLTFAGRIVLVVANIIFMLASIVLIVFGFLLRFAHDVVRPYAKDVLDNIEAKVNSLGYTADFKTDNFELGSSVSDFALFCIIVGLALLAFAIVGWCGACYAIQTIMLVYAIVVIALVLIQIVLVVLVYGFPDTIKTRMETPMKNGLDEYQGLDGTTVVSLTWNWAMQKYECCGVKDSGDFTNRPMWTLKDTLVTPEACCKQLPDTTNARKECAGDQSDSSFDTTAEIAANSNYNKGCLDAIWEKVIADNMQYFLTVALFCIVVQVILIVFAILIFKDSGIKGGLV